MKTITSRIAALAALTLVPAGSFAADTAGVAVSVSVDIVANLTSSVTTTTWTLEEADYDLDGIEGNILSTSEENADVTEIKIATNRNWILQAEGDTADFDYTPLDNTVDDENYLKPASDLSIRKADGTWVALNGTTAVDIINGSRGGRGLTGNTFNLDFKIASSLDSDWPGDYDLGVTLTLVADEL